MPLLADLNQLLIHDDGLSNAEQQRLSRAVADGELRRLARGLYTADLTTPETEFIRHHIWEIVALFIPDGLLVDRSAAGFGRISPDGRLYVASKSRSRDLSLPGTTIVVRPGAPLESDAPWIGGLRLSSPQRILIDNLARSTSSPEVLSRTLSKAELHDYAALLRTELGDGPFREIRAALPETADLLGVPHRTKAADAIMGAALGTRTIRGASRQLAATGAGRPFDPKRIEAFTRFANHLEAYPYDEAVPRFLAAGDPGKTSELAFFEAYYSNYIEGTIFELDEAIDIVYKNEIPTRRPADAHDIAGTYAVVCDAVDKAKTTNDPSEFIEIIAARHARMMVGRPEIGPGVFKDKRNQVGTYVFVEPTLVEGTLRQAVPIIASLSEPLARAAATLFILTEVHPFNDGNGRVARIAMNAELSHAGGSRIVVPIVYRNEFVSALRAGSVDANPNALMRVLAFAWKWTSQMDFSSLALARQLVTFTNADVDSTVAERTGTTLLLPADRKAPAVRAGTTSAAATKPPTMNPQPPGSQWLHGILQD